MTWADAIENAMGVWFDDEFTKEITYDGETVRAHVQYGGRSTGTVANTAVIEVKVANVAAPTYRDPVIIDGVTWRVYRDREQEAIIQGDGYVWQVPIKRDERPGFR